MKTTYQLSSLKVFVCAFALMICVSGNYASGRIGELPKQAAAQKQMQSLDGHSFSLASMRGQVVVMDFFTTWCGHSRLHIPTVKRIDEEERANGAKVIGLAVEEADATVLRFIKEHQIDYPVTTVTDPVFGGYVESRDVSVPQTLVYGRDGRLAAHFVGHSAELDAELAATVKRELGKR